MIYCKIKFLNTNKTVNVGYIAIKKDQKSSLDNQVSF